MRYLFVMIKALSNLYASILFEDLSESNFLFTFTQSLDKLDFNHARDYLFTFLYIHTYID